MIRTRLESFPKDSEASIPGFTTGAFEELVKIFSAGFTFARLNVSTIGDGFLISAFLSLNVSTILSFATSLSFECFPAVIDEEVATFELVDDGDDFSGLCKDTTEAFLLLKV